MVTNKTMNRKKFRGNVKYAESAALRECIRFSKATMKGRVIPKSYKSAGKFCIFFSVQTNKRL